MAFALALLQGKVKVEDCPRVKKKSYKSM
ncbi:MAG: hypothetical protein ACTSR7_08770 [Promethearchaeota archaeon]